MKRVLGSCQSDGNGWGKRTCWPFQSKRCNASCSHNNNCLRGQPQNSSFLKGYATVRHVKYIKYIGYDSSFLFSTKIVFWGRRPTSNKDICTVLLINRCPCTGLWKRFSIFVHRKLKDKITMRSFIIYLNFVSLLAVCLFACNHHSSNPMLQQVDSLLEMKPDSALTILKIYLF